MNNPTVGTKNLLVAAGVGTYGATSGWGIFLGKLPTAPDTAIAITSSSGSPSNPKYLIDYPSVQVLVRGAKNGYEAAYDKALAVQNALLGLPSQTVNGDLWVQVNQIGSIAEMGFDDNNRPLVSVNFALIVEPASGTYRESL